MILQLKEIRCYFAQKLTLKIMIIVDYYIFLPKKSVFAFT